MKKYQASESCGQCGLSHHGESDISEDAARRVAVDKVKKCYRENARAWEAARTRAYVEHKLADACNERVPWTAVVR